MKSIDLLDYTSEKYNGPALRLGAGVDGFEAYQFADQHGLQVVGGFCPTVGIVGGYTQGGGHSPMSSTHGLGADQALAWEVVTANGKHVLASPSQNKDLYWALSGGGGGTYGVVISLTIKAYPDGIVGGASLSFASKGIPRASFWKIFQVWQESLPNLVDSGATAGYALLKDVIPNEIFFVDTITAPSHTESEVEKLLEPTISALKAIGAEYTLSITSKPSYLSHFETYFGPLPNGIYTIHHLFAGRMIPRSVVHTNGAQLTTTIENITENSNSFLGFVALDVSQTKHRQAVAHNAVLPAWRDALITVLAQSTWDFESPRDDGIARANELTYEVIPQLTRMTEGSGTYLNEADFQLQTWKDEFYGVNYDKLLTIKSHYDPDGMFFARLSVGSDAWKLKDDGRLCRVR
ncbi:long-chain-fatty-acid-CoA ligase [Phlyctema vagabunda]|uniref:Long-chain-fatty-acid-CoA ligase n=1 Tax=Phlyctema vagabunda TaxID=108571 RepID=A0ABR4PL12_9HELO